MESEKILSATVTKPVAKTKSKGKSAAVNDEKASLVRASMLPSFMQRKTVSTSDEEKEKKPIRYHNSAVKHHGRAMDSFSEKKSF